LRLPSNLKEFMSTNRTHENVFFAGFYPTFAMSRAIAAKLRANKAKHTTIALYLYLVEIADQSVIRIKTSILENEVNMSAKTIQQAREELVRLKAVTAKETNAKGIWRYTLLNPTGGNLPILGERIDFTEQPSALVTEFYEQSLGQKVAYERDDGNVMFTCPFCRWNKPTLRVTLEEHHDYYGMYICQNEKCAKNGGMIDLEKELAMQTGKELSTTNAARSVRNFFMEWKEPRVPKMHSAMEFMRPGAGAVEYDENDGILP
jgi:hypothetical protein